MTDSTNISEKVDLPKRIVFYDGECGFCNTSVQFILNHRKRPIHFAALQSDIAKEVLQHHNISIAMNTLYYLEEGKLYKKSTGALRITKHLEGGYPVLYFIGILFPKILRDWVYEQVAKRRHRIKPGYCAMPSPEERKLFLSD